MNQAAGEHNGHAVSNSVLSVHWLTIFTAVTQMYMASFVDACRCMHMNGVLGLSV